MTELLKGQQLSKLVLLVLGSGLIMYLVLSDIANGRIDDVTNSLQVQLSEQQSLIATIAEITARNGADEVTESIVRDCVTTDRIRFDELLGRLNAGLYWNELNELESLFGRCADFSAQRKSVMVARFSREVEVYEAYVNQLALIAGESDVEAYRVSSWQQLVEEERKQSELFSKLVVLQEQIIDALLQGKSANSEEIQKILTEVSATQDTLLVANSQAKQLRSELISL